MNGKVGVLLCGHGSRDEAAVAEFHALAEGIARRLPDCRIDVGFLEFARPDIPEALDRLREQGCRRILALPGLLFAAGHVTRDIPALLEAYQARHPETRIRYGRELGLDPRMMEAARKRVEEALTRAGDTVPRGETGVLVVGRGAAAPEITTNIARVGRFVREALGLGWVGSAFSGLAAPLVEPALEEVAGLGYRRVVVFPYLLFTGVLVTRIYRLVDEAAARHPGIEFLKASYLGDHPLVLETFVSRVEEIRPLVAQD